MAEENTLQEMLGSQAKADFLTKLTNETPGIGGAIAAYFAGKSVVTAADAKAKYLKEQEQKDAEKVAFEAQEKTRNTLINSMRAIADISDAVEKGSISPQSASDMTAVLMGDKGMGFGGFKVDFHNKQISVDGKLDPDSDKVYTFTQNADNPEEYTYMDENGEQKTIPSDKVLPVDRLKARAALSLAEKKVDTEISRKKNIEADTQKKLAAKPAGSVKETPKNTIVRTWLASNRDILKDIADGIPNKRNVPAYKAAYLAAKSQGIESEVASNLAGIEAALTKFNEPIPGVEQKPTTSSGGFKIVGVE